MHNFLIFYAPLLVVVFAIGAAFIISIKSKTYEEK